MAAREQVLLMLNEIKEGIEYFNKDEFIEIMNGNKEKNILGLKDILHQIIMEKYHFGSKEYIDLNEDMNILMMMKRMSARVGTYVMIL